MNRFCETVIVLLLALAIVFAGSGAVVMQCCQKECFCSQRIAQTEAVSSRCGHSCCAEGESRKCCHRSEKPCPKERSCKEVKLQKLEVSIPGSPVLVDQPQQYIVDACFSNSLYGAVTEVSHLRDGECHSPPQRDYLRIISVLLI